MERGAVILSVLVVAGIGCAAVAGIEDREGTLCARETHDVCEDFDNEPARRKWTGPDLDDPRTTATLVRSDRSAPNALALRFPIAPPNTQVQGIIGDRVDRDPTGLEVSFDLRVDEIALPDTPLPDLAARDGGPVAPPGGTIAIGIVQWNRGGIALALRHDGAYMFLGPRPDGAEIPEFNKSVPLALKDEIIGRWTHVELIFLLDADEPAVEVRFGERPGKNPTLDRSTKEIRRSTDVIFGGVAIGPTTGTNAITIDNLIADFR